MEEQATRDRRTQYAREFERICRRIEKGPLQEDRAEEWEKGCIARLLTLCVYMCCTDSLREHVKEMILAGTPFLRLPRYLLINTRRGALGVFADTPHIKEFERSLILLRQPIVMRAALAYGEKERAKHMQQQIAVWKENFEKRYGEPAEHGVHMEAITHEIELLSGILHHTLNEELL